MSVKLTVLRNLVLLETPKTVETSSKILLDSKVKQQLAKENNDEAAVGVFKVLDVGPQVITDYPGVKPGSRVFVNNPDAITPVKFGKELFLYTYAHYIDFIVDGEIEPEVEDNTFDMSKMNIMNLKTDTNDYDDILS